MDAEAVLLVDDRQSQVAKGHVVLEQGVGADEDPDFACGHRIQQLLPRLALVAPREDADRDAKLPGQRPDGGEMLAGEDLGGGKQRPLPAGFDRRQQGVKRHHGLAAAHVPLQEPQHGGGGCKIGVDLGDRPFLRAGEREGQDLAKPRRQSPVANGRTPLAPPEPLPHQGERQLVREQFVIGKARAGGGERQDARLILRLVDGDDGLPPGRPAFPLQQRRIDPFGKIAEFGDRLRYGPLQGFPGEPGGQAIYGFDHGQAIAGVGRQDVVGMAHLQAALEPFRAPAHEPPAPLGQDFLEIVAVGMEEDELHLPARVAAGDAVGPPAARRRGMVADDLDHQGHDRAVGRLGDGRRQAAVHHAHRQVPQEVRHAVDVQPGQMRGRPPPDPLEGGRRPEQREQYFWTHRAGEPK